MFVHNLRTYNSFFWIDRDKYDVKNQTYICVWNMLNYIIKWKSNMSCTSYIQDFEKMMLRKIQIN
jgi:hypothetical protein